MFRDPHCLDKFSALLLGTFVAGSALTTGFAPPPGVLEGAIAGAGLWTLLRDKRHAREADALKTLRDQLTVNWQAWGRHSSHADDGMRGHVLASFETVIDRIQITRDDVIAVHTSAQAVADLMVRRAAEAEPELYASRGPHDTERNLARDFLHGIARNAYQSLLENRDYFDRLRPGLWQVMLDGQARLERKIDANTALATQGNEIALQNQALLLKLLEQSGEAASARASGITDERIVALAQQVAEDVDDPEQAFRELEAAVSDAVAYRTAPPTGSNADAALSDLRARLEALADAGQLAQAQTEANEALAQWEAAEAERQAQAAQAGIGYLNEAIRRDLDMRDSEAAAAKLARRVTLETPDPAARFDALRAEQEVWYERGRDKGLRLDLEVAIAIAQISHDKAQDADQRGTALNDLGTALQTLGEREAGTDRLEQAVTACRAALEEYPRDSNPLDWAATQNNLGNALGTLGEREAGTDRLEQAVAAYRAALEERTRDRVPLDWAMTQMNLGNALLTLGEREAGTDRLHEAVSAYRAALEEYTRDSNPLDWATAQMNLGAALTTLGQREDGTDRLEQAVTAYRAALEERTRDRVPLDWAMTQMNLGNALATLGEREAGTDRLHEAVAAYRAALEEYTRDRVPLDWATAQTNLGNALQTLGQREAGTDRLEKAVAAYRAALEERTRDRVPLHWARTQVNLGTALAKLGMQGADTDRLEQAITAYRAALKEYTLNRVPRHWGMTIGGLIGASVLLFVRRVTQIWSSWRRQR
jgi:tetratricopeptide (TPR) repeat protein